MDFSEKKAFIEWFNEAINSKYGSIAESFLLTFPFPNNENHSLYSFAKSIESDRFSSVDDVVTSFKKEANYIIGLLGCSSNASLYIQGYFKELIEKLEFNFSRQEAKKLQFNIDEKNDFFEKIGEDLPNDIDSFLKMTGESASPTTLELYPINQPNNEIAPIELIEKLSKKLEEVTNDHNLAHITEIIQFYQNTGPGDDEESFKFDLSKLSVNTLNKINEYIKGIAPNEDFNNDAASPKK